MNQLKKWLLRKLIRELLFRYDPSKITDILVEEYNRLYTEDNIFSAANYLEESLDSSVNKIYKPR